MCRRHSWAAPIALGLLLVPMSFNCILAPFARLMSAVYFGPTRRLSAASAASFRIVNKHRFYLIGLGYWKDYRTGLTLQFSTWRTHAPYLRLLKGLLGILGPMEVSSEWAPNAELLRNGRIHE